MSRFTWRKGYTARNKREPKMGVTTLEKDYITSEAHSMIQRLVALRPGVAVSVLVLDPADPQNVMAFGNMTPNLQRQLFSTLAGVADDHVTVERVSKDPFQSRDN